MWYVDEAKCLERLGRRQLDVLVYLLSKVDSTEFSFSPAQRGSLSSQLIQSSDEYDLKSVNSVLSDLHMQLNWSDASSSLFLYHIKQIYEGLMHMQYPALTFGIDLNRAHAELVPARSGDHEIDLLQKVARVFHLLLDEPVAGKRFTKSSQKAFMELQQRMMYSVPFASKPGFDYDYCFTHQAETEHYVLQSLLDELIRAELLFQIDASSSDRIAINELLLKRAEKHVGQSIHEEYHNRASHQPVEGQCVFCDPEVIARQCFVEEDQFYILFNYLPYTWPHFMLIPKVHIENLFVQSDEWLVSTGQYLTDFVAKLERYYDTPFMMFNQNGSHAGQTQPHTHIHILPKPNTLNFKIKIASMLYQADPYLNILSDIGMANTRNQAEIILKSIQRFRD